MGTPQSDVARLKTLSPSRISTYLACPVKYRWTYEDGRGRLYLKARASYSFGTTLHRVLESFHQAGQEGVPPTEQVMAEYEESWISAGFSSQEEMSEAFGEGKAILERYAEELRSEPVLPNTLFVEKTLSHPYPRFKLLGRLDRVDERPDGTLEVVDYKTGRSHLTPEDVQGDLAMGVYQLLMKKHYPDRPVCATLVGLRSGQRATYGMSDQELEDFERDLLVVCHWILEADWHEFVPRRKPLCESCDFVPLCRRHEEYES